MWQTARLDPSSQHLFSRTFFDSRSACSLGYVCHNAPKHTQHLFSGLCDSTYFHLTSTILFSWAFFDTLAACFLGCVTTHVKLPSDNFHPRSTPSLGLSPTTHICALFGTRFLGPGHWQTHSHYTNSFSGSGSVTHLNPHPRAGTRSLGLCQWQHIPSRLSGCSVGLWKARGVHLSSTVHCFGFGGTPVSLVLWACWDNSPLPSQHLLSGLIGTPLSSDSKHCFTTSFLWRKVPESDARSVTTPLPSQHCSRGLLEHHSTLPALFSRLVGTTLLHPPSTALRACGTTLLRPPSTCSLGLLEKNKTKKQQLNSQGLLRGQYSSTLPAPALRAAGTPLHPPSTCSLGLLGQHSSTLPAPVLWACWDNTPPPSLHLFSEPVTEALTSSTRSWRSFSFGTHVFGLIIDFNPPPV